MSRAISKQRIAFGVGITLFAALVLFGLTAGAPPSAGVRESTARVLKVVVIAAVGSAAIVAFLATCAAGFWVWLRTGRAFGRVPRWRLGWIFNPEGLSEEGKEARLWLLRVYGALLLIALAAYVLERLGVL